MNTKGQKGFAIVNIVAGVILVMAGFVMFGQPDTGPGGILALLLGAAFWATGGYTLSVLRKYGDDEKRVKRCVVWNTAGFVLSCLVLLACTLLPIIAPLL